mmetsp:Transcript_11463/g.20787  ORF Transcript_11463/g.20787 Transcript_11463/m.20787 type:complete len:103 (+) Transcript_11463:1-309(+)
MIVLAIVFRALRAGAESQFTDVLVCAGDGKASCEDKNNVQGRGAASLLQVNIGAPSQANATKVNTTCKSKGQRCKSRSVCCHPKALCNPQSLKTFYLRYCTK